MRRKNHRGMNSRVQGSLQAFGEKNCFCSIPDDYFVCQAFNYEEVLNIPGIADVTLRSTNGTETLKTSKVLLCSLGSKFEDLLEKNDLIVLPYSMEVIKQLHNFCLSGTIHCDENIADELLRAANEFGIAGVKKFVGEFFMSTLCCANAMKMYFLSKNLLCSHICQKVHWFVLKNFEEIADEPEFLRLCSIEYLESIVKNDFLNISEEKLFLLLKKWSSSVRLSGSDIPRLLKCIRFDQMDPAFFMVNVITWTLARQHSDVVRTQSRISSPLQLRHKPERCRVPREFVLAVGGYTIDPSPSIEAFDTRARRWQNLKQNFPSHAYHGMLVHDNKVFVFGGFGNYRGEMQHFRDVFCLDLLKNKWKKRNPMRVGRCYVSVAKLNGKMYCMGGCDGINRHRVVECYDPEEDQWTEVCPMIEIRSDASAVVYEGKIWMIGGFTGEDILRSTEIYDSQTNEWTRGPSLNVPRSGVKAVVYMNKIHVFGGYDGETRLKSVEVLDPLERTWKFGAEMITTRSNFAVTVIEKKILVLGGFDGFGVIRDAESYSDETGTWVPCPSLNIKKSALNAVTISDLPNRVEYIRPR